MCRHVSPRSYSLHAVRGKTKSGQSWGGADPTVLMGERIALEVFETLVRAASEWCRLCLVLISYWNLQLPVSANPSAKAQLQSQITFCGLGIGPQL